MEQQNTDVSNLETFGRIILRREKCMEDYLPYDTRLHDQVLVLIFHWAQIRLCNWVERQWRSTSDFALPDLSLLWERIDIQEVWEPTLPAVLCISPLDL